MHRVPTYPYRQSRSFAERENCNQCQSEHDDKPVLDYARARFPWQHESLLRVLSQTSVILILEGQTGLEPAFGCYTAIQLADSTFVAPGLTDPKLFSKMIIVFFAFRIERAAAIPTMFFDDFLDVFDEVRHAVIQCEVLDQR